MHVFICRKERDRTTEFKGFPMTGTTLGERLEQKPFTLALSAGFFGFYAHGGMAAALLDAGLKPARYTGSSAGSLIGGCLAAGMQIRDIQELLFALRRHDFWDPALGWGLLRGDKMDALLRAHLGHVDIQALPTDFSCSAWCVRDKETVSFVRGDLVHAIRASSAFPMMFQPVVIDGARYLDGGIRDRPGLHAVAEHEPTLYHHLSTRSPWRLKGAPRYPDVGQSIHLLDLGAFQKLGPTRLYAGPAVWGDAYERTRKALDTDVGKNTERRVIL